MNTVRCGEQGRPPPFRSKRVFRASGYWYFNTREGTRFGPFRDRQEVRKALAVFVAQDTSDHPPDRRGCRNRPGAQDGIDHMVREVFDILRCYKDFGPRAARTWAESRLEDLEMHSETDADSCDCLDVVRYVMDRVEQILDFGLFQGNRA